jgi:galactokinase
MMGGGFGGCTINLIEKNKINIFLKDISNIYLDNFNKKLTPINVSIADGLTYKKTN